MHTLRDTLHIRSHEPAHKNCPLTQTTLIHACKQQLRGRALTHTSKATHTHAARWEGGTSVCSECVRACHACSCVCWSQQWPDGSPDVSLQAIRPFELASEHGRRVVDEVVGLHFVRWEGVRATPRFSDKEICNRLHGLHGDGLLVQRLGAAPLVLHALGVPLHAIHGRVVVLKGRDKRAALSVHVCGQHGEPLRQVCVCLKGGWQHAVLVQVHCHVVLAEGSPQLGRQAAEHAAGLGCGQELKGQGDIFAVVLRHQENGGVLRGDHREQLKALACAPHGKVVSIAIRLK
mmetsp:Transcript_10068/g.25159  ORF Transcript_10068/g.25159 Transcript_10068/m.25159 type:complete len:290 (+) Transcript_10068:210-1079(+)